MDFNGGGPSLGSTGGGGGGGVGTAMETVFIYQRKTGTTNITESYAVPEDGIYAAMFYVLALSNDATAVLTSDVSFTDENSVANDVGGTAALGPGLVIDVSTAIQQLAVFTAKSGSNITFTSLLTLATGTPAWSAAFVVTKIG